MILLSEDGKSLVKIEKWQDVIDRPGYTSKVDPKKITLKQIIGRYHIDPKEPCGISSCGTAHNMGYLVLCEGGIETNIGNKCGKRIFGVDFQTLEKTFNRDTNAQRYRENISRFKNQIGSYDSKIQQLFNLEREFGGVEKVVWQVTKGFEQKTLDALYERAKRQDNVIYRTVALSEKEKEIAKESGSISKFKTDPVAVISGLSCVRDYKKLRCLLNVVFKNEVAAFKALNEDTLTFNELKRWNNWSNKFDKSIRKSEKIIDECRRFLAAENIQTIRSYKSFL